MLDAKKYLQHFPDESRRFAAAKARPASLRATAPSSPLLAALSQLEREFREILRSQQAQPTDPSE